MNAKTSTPAIDIDDLHFFRGEKEILHSLNLKVEEGTFLGIVGPNGGGKTTLCRLILGILKPTEGQVRLFGVPATVANQERTLVGYVPQRLTPPEGFPGRAIDIVLMAVAHTLSPFRRAGKDLLARARHCLEKVDLADRAESPIDTLSGGQHQRVLMARALMSDPKLLILDEPLEGVDVDGRQRFMALVKELIRERKLTVVMVSHDIAQLVEFSDRVACLDETVHWHDRAELLQKDVLADLYSCELNLMLADRERREKRVHELHEPQDESG